MLMDDSVNYFGNLISEKYLELTRGLKPWAIVFGGTDKIYSFGTPLRNRAVHVHGW
jgi:hypothetical protein